MMVQAALQTDTVGVSSISSLRMAHQGKKFLRKKMLMLLSDLKLRLGWGRPVQRDTGKEITTCL